jgi:hypothetical protein
MIVVLISWLGSSGKRVCAKSRYCCCTHACYCYR